ncbi:hypothetical protein H6G89_00160 [Oscillatoria sp. FACHB-1407]|uniref:hypothetical protein n=1 Tax=Oscillatoria sp. FACHB-1407 TaxID=2692847 RepID=UPI0016831283|nr:hypothetical protein [Oscillatoria sp. FACHB-1407]MBD2459444.1 hypothetical protein [Oscillatoria sp. FACHB-1407]
MVQKRLTTSLFEKTSDPSKIRLWFVLSLIPTLYFSLFGVFHAFSREYIVQDDVRQHVFWMQRFVNPDLFPNDQIADYFQAVAPVGYKALYYAASNLGIDPLLLAKLLPVPLGLITAVYGFAVAFQILPIPFAAFVGNAILTQSLWIEDDIVTGTPRAFLYPFLLAFLYYLLKKSPLPCLLAIALQSLFYPQLALVQVGILTMRLIQWRNGRFTLSRKPIDYSLWGIGAAIVLGLVLIFSQDIGVYGPTPTLEQMQVMPEFLWHGRAKFFDPNPFGYWFTGDSGISPTLDLPIIWMSLLLPFLLKRHPLARWISPNIRILTDTLVPSFALFALAHLLLLRLYVPSRYTQHTLRVVMALAAGIVVTMLIASCLRWLQQSGWTGLRRSQKLLVGLWGFFLAISIIIPAIPPVFLGGHNQVPGRSSKVYEFFAQQPPDILVASSSLEATNIPTFSKRSILASWEYALPYHLGYYNPIRQRALDLMQAQYSPNLDDVKQFIEQYGVDFFLIEKGDFKPEYVQNNFWLIQYQPQANEAIARLQQRRKAAMARLIRPCSVLETSRLFVLDARCITEAQLR